MASLTGLERVKKYIGIAEELGARFLIDGRKARPEKPLPGYFIGCYNC
jgi:hypothetical protein